MSFTRVGTSAGNYENFNTIWTFTDNLSKIVGKAHLQGRRLHRKEQQDPALDSGL